jgi:hypothetical protein
MPLSYRRQLFGHILLDLNLDHAFSYGPLAEAVTTALRGSRALTHGVPESGQRSVSGIDAAFPGSLSASLRVPR